MQKPVVVFIPFFKGKEKDIKKNIDLVREFGFETKVFEPPYYGRPLKDVLKSTLTGGLKANFLDKWSYDLNKWLICNNIRNKDIIFYSFSAPSFMVLRYVFEFKDLKLKAWVCEGGPFVHFLECLFNYMLYAEKVKFLPKRLLFIFTDYFLWGGFFKLKKLKKQIKLFPSSTPILSIRGLKDKITPYHAIDDLFKINKNLNLKVLNLDCSHLRGVNDSKEKYKKELGDFLNSLS